MNKAGARSRVLKQFKTPISEMSYNEKVRVNNVFKRFCVNLYESKVITQPQLKAWTAKPLLDIDTRYTQW